MQKYELNEDQIFFWTTDIFLGDSLGKLCVGWIPSENGGLLPKTFIKKFLLCPYSNLSKLIIEFLLQINQKKVLVNLPYKRKAGGGEEK